MPYTHVLDIVHDLLSEKNGEENEKLLEIYKELIEDEHIKRAGVVPTLENFKKYLMYLKSGFAYAQRKFGEHSLPTHLMFFEKLITDDTEYNALMAYFPEEDMVGITYLHIAKLCALYEERCLKTEPRLKGYVTPQNMTRL